MQHLLLYKNFYHIYSGATLRLYFFGNTGAYMANATESLRNQILNEMSENPLIHDTSHVNVIVKSTGSLFWKTSSIQVSGRVDKEQEKNEINKILEKCCSEVEYTNTLRVEMR